ncbi:hypothetical protein PtB15_10B497 [Puccinia triticina]|nr:hypothetical protein PtB15_10B497 [Puccinia triticina]
MGSNPSNQYRRIKWQDYARAETSETGPMARMDPRMPTCEHCLNLKKSAITPIGLVASD